MSTTEETEIKTWEVEFEATVRGSIMVDCETEAEALEEAEFGINVGLTDLQEIIEVEAKSAKEWK